MKPTAVQGEWIAPASTLKKPAGDPAVSRESFGKALTDAIKDVNRLQLEADQAIRNLEVGKTGSLHEAMIALEKADVSFRAMMQVRNKILEAYQEIMRMQV
ncbi:MAG TPA: flagellar hook-basal body complex protein FliE [Syntrophales bacterium]|jgi:flagellar hook-basal body complex protein FliE|nr:flagellar hook-basal body complex protein FliE [Syntrophales bacterium]